MSTKKKPRRKAYAGPKYVSTNPMKTFLGGMQETHADHLQSTLLLNHTALSNIARGVGDKADWERLVGAINVALIMTEQGSAIEHVGLLAQARQALLETGMRAVRNNHRFLFTGTDLRTMNEAMEVHDLQLQTARAVDLERAAAEVEKRLRHRINSTSVMGEMRKLGADAA